MATLREKTQSLIRLISSRVEETAYNELPTHVIALCGATAGALATLVLLAVAHLGDVIVLGHHYAFLIGYVATVFSATSLIVLHTIIGAIAAYVHLRAEEYLNSGQWLAFACFFPLFASTGTYIAERLTEMAWIGGSQLAPPLRLLIAIVTTFAMTWLFWIPWLSFYRIWLARRTRLQQRSMSDDPTMPSPSGSSLEASRSHMRIRRQIALIRRHRTGDANGTQLLNTALFGDASIQAAAPADTDESGGTGNSAGRARLARRLPVVGMVALAVILIGGALYSSMLPGGIRGVFVREGAARCGEPVRIIMRSEGLGTEFVRALANEALGGVSDDGWVDVLDVSRFSMFALRTVMSDGQSGVVISTRQDLIEMDRLGMLIDLKPLVQRDQVDLLTFVDSCMAELSSGDKVFGLPLSTSPLLLYINTEALSHTDLIPGVPPVLWSDLLHYAKTLTWFADSGGTPIVSQLGFTTSSSLWHAWLQLAFDPVLSGSDPGPESHSYSLTPMARGDEHLTARNGEHSAASDGEHLGSSGSKSSGSGASSAHESAAMPDSSIPGAWRLLVDVASGLRATSLPDDVVQSRNPFYEQPYDPAALFASGLLAMVVADYGLHAALSNRYTDVQYGVADMPVPNWAASGVSISSGLGIGILRPDSGASSDAAALVEASWQIVKAIANDSDMQARVAERAGMLPGLKSLYSLPSEHRPQRRSLCVGNEEIEAMFHASQLSALPATNTDLPSSSLARLYGLLDRLTQGAESVSDVMEQIAVTISSHKAK